MKNPDIHIIIGYTKFSIKYEISFFEQSFDVDLSIRRLYLFEVAFRIEKLTIAFKTESLYFNTKKPSRRIQETM
jgi:hypothetical protein